MLKDNTIRTRYSQAVVSAITGKQVVPTFTNNSNSLDGHMAICTGNGVRVRSSMDTSNLSNIIGKLNNGDKVKIFKRINNWYSIYYGNHGGYVSIDYIRLL